MTAPSGAGAISQGGAADPQNALRFSVQKNVVFNRIGRFQGPLDEAPQIGITDDFVQISALKFCLMAADKFGGGGVERD